jgi:hypothetical protein
MPRNPRYHQLTDPETGCVVWVTLGLLLLLVLALIAWHPWAP